jgi:hypothetical protein
MDWRGGNSREERKKKQQYEKFPKLQKLLFLLKQKR